MMQLPGYDIERVLGEGGMARVFLGRQRSLDRPVAIKVLLQDLSDDALIRQRFERESKIIARLNHPNIVHVIDQGIAEGGEPYFVMEYFKSISLDKAMKATQVSIRRKLNVFIQLAKALAYAHRNGVIHRDIKPDNILLDYEGHVQILDFGIARLFDEDDAVAEADAKQVMGSFNYMPPELRRSADKASPHSDLYSLGVVMYEFLTGALPADPPKPPSELNASISKGLDEIVLSCLEPRPYDRPESADTLRVALLGVSQGDHIAAEIQQEAAADVKKEFVLLDVLTENPTSACYLFEEAKHKRLYFIRKLPPNAPGFLQSQHLCQLQHPLIAQVYGATRNTRAFITVSEYLDSGSLEDRLHHPYESEEFLAIALPILDALNYAHEHKVVHGGLDAKRILLSHDRQIKIVDFGVRASDQRPEPAVDLRDLGQLFYRMLSGDKYANQARDEGVPASLPKRLEPLVMALINAGQPGGFKSMSQAYQAFQQLLQAPDKAAPKMAPESEKTAISAEPAKPSRKGMLLAILLAALAITGLNAAFLLGLFN